ncbi:hypothetical protein NDU88_004377 [Pleurodeles waltl]|uniref:Uncharacterized protein n=1 Tax=Pleurodeles waltl TaxID=8319 RepID=A0AAV7T7Y7_PLEWA|nr:hypothetical protein NDU88_004377 [Pleurodeles waltl]
MGLCMARGEPLLSELLLKAPHWADRSSPLFPCGEAIASSRFLLRSHADLETDLASLHLRVDRSTSLPPVSPSPLAHW